MKTAAKEAASIQFSLLKVGQASIPPFLPNHLEILKCKCKTSGAEPLKGIICQDLFVDRELVVASGKMSRSANRTAAQRCYHQAHPTLYGTLDGTLGIWDPAHSMTFYSHLH
jgi:hypothetical protein